MPVAENKDLVRRWIAEIDKTDPAVVARYIAEDYLDHSPPPYPGLPAGREGVRRAFEMALTAWVVWDPSHRQGGPDERDLYPPGGRREAGGALGPI